MKIYEDDGLSYKMLYHCVTIQKIVTDCGRCQRNTLFFRNEIKETDKIYIRKFTCDIMDDVISKQAR
jgi:hypothetical protein